MQSLVFRLAPHNLWRRFVLNHLEFSDNYKRFELAYLRKDPYRLAGEQLRYSQTNQIIRSAFGHPASLLEIGCAEGYQSLHLLDLCEELHGVDVSNRAVARARRRCPKGKFAVGDVFSVGGSFDLVVACEVLYFAKDVCAVLRRMSELGSACLITYYTTYCNVLDPYFVNVSSENKEVIQYQNNRWNVIWWKGSLV